MPLAVIKSVVEISSLAPLAPATGNVGRVYRLDAGVLERGRPADLMLLDTPLGSPAQDALRAISRGDIPAIAGLFTGGELRFLVSRNTPPPTRRIRILKDETRRWT